VQQLKKPQYHDFAAWSDVGEIPLAPKQRAFAYRAMRRREPE
jgi:hypothetical protein